AVDFCFGERNGAIQVFQIAISQERIIQHGAKRWRHRHGQAEMNAVTDQSFEHLPERDIGLGNGLKKPIFFQEVWVLRMPYKWEVGMQQECEIAFSHRTCGTERNQPELIANDK